MLKRLKAFLSAGRTQADQSADIIPANGRQAMHGKFAGSLMLQARADALFDAGKIDEAGDCFRQALAMDADDVAALLGLCRVLKEKGQLAAAQQQLDRAKALAPGIADVEHLQGALFHAQNQLDEAIPYYQRAIALNPDLAVAYRDLGIAFTQNGQVASARQTFDRGIAADPAFAELHFYSGNLRLDENDAAGALAAYEKALAIYPEQPAWLLNKGVALQTLKQFEPALHAYREAARLAPGYAEAHNHCGSVLIMLRRYADAVASFDLAIRLKPDYFDALKYRAHALRFVQRPVDALASIAGALQIDPDHAEARHIRALALHDLHRHQEALQSFAQALQIKPDDAEAHRNEGLCRLQMGDFSGGWPKYEWRRQTERFNQEFWRKEVSPLWLGKGSLAGKTILLKAEQGLGDTFQFCRYVPLVADLGAKVLLEVQAPLVSVLAGLPGNAQIFKRGDDLPAHDYHCQLLSLPTAFDTRLDSIPADIPYLRSEPERVQFWREKLGSTDRPRVGLVWAGNAEHQNDHNRSIALDRFCKIVSTVADFICLQMELRPTDISILREIARITFFAEDLKDFVDTAALIELMDVIISVDTSVAHLVGALGKPLWLLLPYRSDFRWLLEREDSPWYPSARLFRQPAAGDWGSVLDRVTAALDALVPDRAAAGAQAPGKNTSGRNQSTINPVETTPGARHSQLAKADACFDAGDLNPAADCYRQLLAMDEADVEANTGLARVLKAQGKPREAEPLLRKAIVHAADIGESHYLLGSVLQEQGKLDEAIQCYRQALILDPDWAVAYRELCFAYFQNGQAEAAAQIITEGITRHPEFADLHFFRGNLHVEAGNPAAALPCFERALALSPDVAAWHFNCGVALQDLKRHEEALASYQQALRLQPDYPDALNNRGGALLHLKRDAEALACFDHALHLNPNSVDALNNRGSALRGLGRLDEALASYAMAIAQKPEHAEAHNNLAMALQDLHRHQEALASYARSIAARPDYAEAHFNEGLCRLQLGDFVQGWPKYEWRRDTATYLKDTRGDQGKPLWLGKESLQGKTILLQAEQGFGDTIQFCRYATLVAQRGATVLLEVQGPIKSAMAELDGTVQVLARGETIPPYDFHCPLLSLPLAFATRLDTIPAGVPYLRADPLRLEAWRAKLGATSKPRIGLVWSGNAEHLNDRNRSIPLADFAPLISPSAQYYCLQKDVRPADQAVIDVRGDIIQFGESLKDFADTAALVELMDVVVSVDTSVAHLAGALGKPLVLLLPFSPDFRWLLDRADSPWYPSAKLFRQSVAGGWSSVIREVATALDNFVRGEPLTVPGQNLGVSAATEPPVESNMLALLCGQGDAYLNGGNFQAALDRFNSALAIDANDALPWTGLARVAIEQGKFSDAGQQLQMAIALEPANVKAGYLLGAVFQAQLRIDDAIAQFNKVLQIQPDHALSLRDLAFAYFQSGDRNNARETLRTALALHPKFADLHFYQGNLLVEQGDLENAIQSFQEAISIAGDIAAWHFNLAFALQSQQRNDAALQAYERVLELEPAFPNADNNRAGVLLALNRPGEALNALDRALRLNPDSADCLSNRGLALIELRRPAEAMLSLDAALIINPYYPEAHNNRGTALRDLGRFNEALASFDEAIRLRPTYVQALSNRGVVEQDLGRHEEALSSFAAALRIEPTDREANFGEALCRLRMGDFESGWQKYEFRERDPHLVEFANAHPQPIWLGKESPRGKTILVCAEQGFGDTIQFCRLLARLNAMGARVLLEVQPALKSTLAQLAGVSSVIARGDPIPPFDYHCPLLSLPLALELRIDTVSAPVPYLHADGSRVSEWAKRLGPKAKPRIGLVWSGNPDHKNDHNRSIPLAQFAAMLTQDSQFVCLQIEVQPGDLTALTDHPDILFVGDQMRDFADTAALISLMDAIVTVDTSIAHLAGAMAKPVLIMLPFNADFRWLIGRNDSPWYPTARLFRQTEAGAWDGVISAVARQLRAMD